ncbi:DNA methyltransferase [Natronincola ferrireducens]|uniref:Methyltransferase n=1 Tax=Natronincola ferrireducens TaxID=393762 RepID=A0A1G9IFG9_9FIRM|nr:DNA methyltransferase [Natronincola ferrireducens]SDL23583.1 DNA binding domain-containing protein, excisionase family [Natronincola ferrireducens]
MTIVIKDKELLTTQETANYLGVSKSTVYRMVKNEILKPIKTPGGQRRFEVKELENYKDLSRKGNNEDKRNIKKKETEQLQIKVLDDNNGNEKNQEDGESQEDVGTVDPRNKLNNLTGKQWMPETKSFWYQKGLGSKHPHAKIERQHPAPFSFQDIARLILFFTKENEIVLDPFSGVGSTIKACAMHNREGIGIELSQRWNDLAIERIEFEVGEGESQKHTFINGDSTIELKKIEDDSIDFMVTSPPYWSILNKKADHKVKNERLKNNLATNYSDDEKDLGNISDYQDFLTILVDNIFMECARALKPSKYMSLVVSDFRNQSEFISFHSDLIQAMNKRKINNKYELSLQGVKVLLQNHKSLLPYGYPFAYVENIHHQYIVIFRKTEIKKKKKR